MRRGNAAFAEGDITAARLLFERAEGTSAVAATAKGKTYDPNVLSQVRARGIQPDRNAAEFWYRRAIEMGDPQAADLLERLRAVPHG
jgi:TPR repeat protein